MIPAAAALLSLSALLIAIPLASAEDPSFWQQKIISFFHKLDLDDDDVVTKDDYLENVDRYVKYGSLTEDQEHEIREKTLQQWDLYWSPVATDGRVTEEAFLAAVTKNKNNLSKTCKARFSTLFDIIDISGDGIVQKEEHSLFFRVFDISQEDADLAFTATDIDIDDVLSVEDFVTSACEYLTSEDPGLNSDLTFGLFEL